MQSTQEQWLPIPGYEGRYEVSDHGRVRSLSRTFIRSDGQIQGVKGRELFGTVIPSGHVRVQLRRNGRPDTLLVHRLVLESFVGPCPDGMEACHFNDIPTDNRLSNLRWGTKSDNALDRVRNGRDRFASRTHCSQGHEYTEENTYKRPGFPQYRYCRACNKAAKARYQARRVARLQGARP